MRVLWSSSILVLFLLGTSPAGAVVLRYQGIERGDVAITGNALGLSKALNLNGPGTRDSIGTFMASSSASIDSVPVSTPPWPAGTTSAWASNGSSAELSLSGGAVVRYAELVWGGSTNYVENVTPFLDVAVGLAGPGGSCGSESPDPATAVTLSQFSGAVLANYYMRSADVTACILANGAGRYTVTGVPATQHESVNSLNAAGWSLIVAYHDPSLPVRNLVILTDGTLVDEAATSSSIVTGLETPDAGVVTGRLVAAALEGDASSTGDALRIGPTGGPFVALNGPNNPAANFFASQINDSAGLLDGNGTFGQVNHDALTATNVAGARQGFDTTGILLSSGAGHVGNDQTAIELQAISSGDMFISLAFGLAVDRASTEVPLLSATGRGLLVACVLGVGGMLASVRRRRDGRARTATR